ncbi:Fic family protein [Aeromicrobium alkaliterrae]|uniref:Fic family protein n=1 Tax=Aeromicrobium alkaliterrae TaxID=302168 RepID=A0ABP4VJ07_9ACTN
MTIPDADRPLDWAPHVDEVVPWTQTVPQGPRADRAVREIVVRRPPTIAGLSMTHDRSLKVTMDSALAGLAQLDLTHGRKLGALDQLLLRTESVSSSKIENIEASLGDYGKALHGGRANASAVSMAAATRALADVIGDAGRTGQLRLEAMLAAHHQLFERHPEMHTKAGRTRTVQNWIGGSDYSPRNALFVPPPPDTVAGYLEDLFAFANRDDVPVLVQAAVVHAQFESIHPFVDGNGRIGRTLIHAILRRRRATRNLTVPIASGLVAHRDRYFDALAAYREGHARPMVGMLTNATLVASHEARRTATTIHEISREWEESLGGVLPGSPEHRLLRLLVAEPIITVDLASLGTGYAGAELRHGIDRLEDAGVLTVKGRRSQRIWTATAILEELQDLTVRIESVTRRVDASG